MTSKKIHGWMISWKKRNYGQTTFCVDMVMQRSRSTKSLLKKIWTPNITSKDLFFLFFIFTVKIVLLLTVVMKNTLLISKLVKLLQYLMLHLKLRSKQLRSKLQNHMNCLTSNTKVFLIVMLFSVVSLAQKWLRKWVILWATRIIE